MNQPEKGFDIYKTIFFFKGDADDKIKHLLVERKILFLDRLEIVVRHFEKYQPVQLRSQCGRERCVFLRGEKERHCAVAPPLLVVEEMSSVPNHFLQSVVVLLLLYFGDHIVNHK